MTFKYIHPGYGDGVLAVFSGRYGVKDSRLNKESLILRIQNLTNGGWFHEQEDIALQCMNKENNTDGYLNNGN